MGRAPIDPEFVKKCLDMGAKEITPFASAPLATGPKDTWQVIGIGAVREQQLRTLFLPHLHVRHAAVGSILITPSAAAD